MMLRTLFLVFLAFSSPLFVAPAAATDAEMLRLEAEMDSLARRNAWSGVERVYVQMVATDTTGSTTAHHFGSQAAQTRGDMLEAMKRLRAAVAAPVSEEPGADVIRDTVTRELALLEQRYGIVDIKVESPRIPALVRAGQMPFADQERESIVAARSAVAESRIYEGLLPVGRYMIDGEFFEVKPGEDLEVRVAKLR